ncbi:MAG: hypothetical protein P9M03_08785, partial [Candidatus Theseobacter exili]|nr:hypothetical protein [Candidatus Theseobacter exili]
PSTVVVEKGYNVFLLTGEVEFSAPRYLRGFTNSGWYSPSYGVKKKTKVLNFEYLSKAHLEVMFQIRLL